MSLGKSRGGGGGLLFCNLQLTFIIFRKNECLVGFYNWRSSVKIFKSVLALSVLLTMLIACGDDSSSSSVIPEPANDSSSSVAPASSDDDQSSSSVTDKETSSGGSSRSSSSVSSKNSSSSVVESSSSIEIDPVCVDGDTSIKDGYGQRRYRTCRNGRWETDSSARLDSLDSLAAIEKK